MELVSGGEQEEREELRKNSKGLYSEGVSITRAVVTGNTAC